MPVSGRGTTAGVGRLRRARVGGAGVGLAAPGRRPDRSPAPGLHAPQSCSHPSGSRRVVSPAMAPSPTRSTGSRWSTHAVDDVPGQRRVLGSERPWPAPRPTCPPPRRPRSRPRGSNCSVQESKRAPRLQASSMTSPSLLAAPSQRGLQVALVDAVQSQPDARLAQTGRAAAPAGAAGSPDRPCRPTGRA